jgi:hypothetical protein
LKPQRIIFHELLCSHTRSRVRASLLSSGL